MTYLDLYTDNYSSKNRSSQIEAQKKLDKIIRSSTLSYDSRFATHSAIQYLYVEEVVKGKGVTKRVVLPLKSIPTFLIHGATPFTSEFHADYSTTLTVKYNTKNSDFYVVTDTAMYTLYPVSKYNLKKLKITDTEPVLDLNNLKGIEFKPLKLAYTKSRLKQLYKI